MNDPALSLPLTEDEFAELDAFLRPDAVSTDTMTLDVLDGYLHALAVGPVSLPPSRWLPRIWGSDHSMPHMAAIDRLNHILGLIQRHYDAILRDLAATPPEVCPLWAVTVYRKREYDDADGWAAGFLAGMDLCRADWDPVLETPEGQAWFRPFGLLALDAFSAEQDELARTPARRARLAATLPAAVLAMHAFWQPRRIRDEARPVPHLRGEKTGRNDPCPCGSGRKHKKCCGAAAGS